MKTLLSLFAIAIAVVTAAAAPAQAEFTLGGPGVLSISLEGKSAASAQAVDLGLDHSYAVIRVGKPAGAPEVTALVTSENLAACQVLFVAQGPETAIADVFVSFEPENDGGFNSCQLVITTPAGAYAVTLGAKVGE